MDSIQNVGKKSAKCIGLGIGFHRTFEILVKLHYQSYNVDLVIVGLSNTKTEYDSMVLFLFHFTRTYKSSF